LKGLFWRGGDHNGVVEKTQKSGKKEGFLGPQGEETARPEGAGGRKGQALEKKKIQKSVKLARAGGKPEKKSK